MVSAIRTFTGVRRLAHVNQLGFPHHCDCYTKSVSLECTSSLLGQTVYLRCM